MYLHTHTRTHNSHALNGVSKLYLSFISIQINKQSNMFWGINNDGSTHDMLQKEIDKEVKERIVSGIQRKGKIKGEVSDWKEPTLLGVVNQDKQLHCPSIQNPSRLDDIS